MIINWKDIILKPYTRGIVRQVNEKMLEGVIVKQGAEAQMEVPAINWERSEALLVSLMSGLSMSELDDIAVTEYEALKNEINKEVQGKKK
mgnify:CR=1 FL=1